MWHLINPKLDPSVPQEKCIEFVKDLLYLAIDTMYIYMKDGG